VKVEDIKQADTVMWPLRHTRTALLGIPKIWRKFSEGSQSASQACSNYTNLLSATG